MYHVTRAKIDLAAAANNYRAIRAYIDRTRPDADMICIVKADAYGHGADRMAGIYRSLGARSFAVSNLDEAVALRAALGNGCMILILGYTDPAFAGVLCKNDITQAVFSAEYAHALHAELQEDLRVHFKVDTGMNRIGFASDDAGIAQMVECARLPHFVCDGVFTHFACADETDDTPTRAQFARFMRACDALETAGIHPRLRHACNSAGALRFPEMYLDAVRCGIILYGLDPSEQVRAQITAPVMSLWSRVIHIHTVAPGEGISYGGTYTPERPIRVATVPIGYGDGLLRVYGAPCGVYINEKYAKILGRVCMDQCMVDVTDIPCAVGDAVEVFGSCQSADALARAVGTIGYEVTCTVGKRVPRDEVNGDQTH